LPQKEQYKTFSAEVPFLSAMDVLRKPGKVGKSVQ